MPVVSPKDRPFAPIHSRRLQVSTTLLGLTYPSIGQPKAVGASGSIYLREALESLGGFDNVMFGEDGRICVNARQSGYRIAYASNTFNYHDFTDNFRVWRGKCMKGGAGGANKYYPILLTVSPFLGMAFMMQGIFFTREWKTAIGLPFYYPLKWFYMCWGTFKERVPKIANPT